MTLHTAILVIGHRNPDLDAIASAIGYAWVLNQPGADTFTPARLGEVNAQTAFALRRFAVDAPLLVTDVRPRLIDTIDTVPTLAHTSTLLDACRLMARSTDPVPLLNADGMPLGLVSSASVFAQLVEPLGTISMPDVSRILDQPAASALDPFDRMLTAQSTVHEVISAVLRSEQDFYIVVDDAGRYVGLTQKSALLAPARARVALVDHNEPSQSVPGLDEADIVEVLDHHRLGALPTTLPVRVQIEPVGSCSTLVAERSAPYGDALPSAIAGLLLCGILSDTLVFRSPTTTQRDHAAALTLARRAGLAPSGADDEAFTASIHTLGAELLAAGAGLGTRSASEIVSGDIKYYDVGSAKAGVAQVEVSRFDEVSAHLPALRVELARLVETQGLALAALLITDVIAGNSRLLAVGSPAVVGALPYPRLPDGTLDAPGVVSRKKQLLPAVLSALA